MNVKEDVGRKYRVDGVTRAGPFVVQFLTGGIKSISAFLEEVTKICIQVQFLMLNNMERADATPFEPMP